MNANKHKQMWTNMNKHQQVDTFELEYKHKQMNKKALFVRILSDPPLMYQQIVGSHSFMFDKLILDCACLCS